MQIIRSIKKMQRFAVQAKGRGKTIGFVPTMGYLHEGHLSLARQAAKDTDIVVMSIFVNPAQFGPGEDFKKYPRDLSRDSRLAGLAGVDVIFYPAATAMYPKGYQTYVEVTDLSRYLCGAFRPGHFKGVATIVMKLFNIVRPDIAYFGQKDAQQAIIIKRMAVDLNMDLRIRVMPIVREPDGLATSSRNVYLSPTERHQALVLKNALQKAKYMINYDEKDPGRIKGAMRRIIVRNAPSAKIDYISIVDPQTLRDLKTLACRYNKPGQAIKGKILIALAVRIAKTRLIDNAQIYV
jgi:pantoate--beta-alanine ligase